MPPSDRHYFRRARLIDRERGAQPAAPRDPEAARLLGTRARERGNSRHSNPYQGTAFDTDLYVAWLAGYTGAGPNLTPKD